MQAARGTPLKNSGHTPGSTRRTHLAIFAAVALIGLTIDQATKAWAVATLPDGDRELVGDWLTLHLVFNPGAAFSTGTEFTIVFTALAAVAVCVVLYLSRRLGDPLWALGLGFLLAGVAGNLADRLFRDPTPLRGHVVDFLRLPNWPVFNFADIFINVAAAVIIVQSLRGIALDGTRDSAPRAEQGDQT
ncbi:signal peptidase II [Nocardioides sp. 616]|uniref:signal peptidase II n=1 Tax=Nocardioides sp. 616 TaxID=2268090 RepID=UPI000CE4290F|nr:signal peptidase II [Nocardioides sp. 616]